MDDVVWFTKVLGRLPPGPHTALVRSLMAASSHNRPTEHELLSLQTALAVPGTPQDVKDLALILGAKAGSQEVVAVALAAGACVGAHSNAAIRYAARTNSTEVGEALLAAGADGGACGGEPLQQACRMDALEFAHLMWSATLGNAARARAARAARAAGSQRVLLWLLPLVVEEEVEAFVLACATGNLPLAKTMASIGIPDVPGLLAKALKATRATDTAMLAWLRTLKPTSLCT